MKIQEKGREGERGSEGRRKGKETAE